MQATRSVYLVTLAKATPNPLLKETDEEGSRSPARTPRIPTRSKDSKEKQGRPGRAEDPIQATGPEEKAADPRKKAGDKDKPVVIDLDGIPARVVALPVEAGHIQDLAAGADGQDLLHPPRGVRPGQVRPRGQAIAEAVRPQDPRGGDARRGDRRIPALGRPQEDPLPAGGPPPPGARS